MNIPQVQGAVIPFVAQPAIDHEDDLAMVALGDLFGVLQVSQGLLVEDGQRTQESVQLFFAQMQLRLVALAEENDRLRAELIASEGRQREVALVHRAEVDALKGQVASVQEFAQTSVSAVRKEMVQVSARADASVAAALAAQQVALQTVTQAGDARVIAATQAGDARVAAAHAETAVARQEHAQCKNELERANGRLNLARGALYQFQTMMNSDMQYAQLHRDTPGFQQALRARDQSRTMFSVSLLF